MGNWFGGDSRLHIEFAAVGDDNLLGGLAALGTEALDLLDKLLALDHLAEDHVAAVQPGGLDGGDEELRAVGVGASVGHRKQVGLVVLELKVLVVEAAAVDGLATAAVARGEVAALKHKVGDHAVESAALVVKRLAGLAHALLASAQGAEVVNGLGDDVAVEPKLDAAGRLAIDLNIEVGLLGDLRIGHGDHGHEGSDEERESGLHFARVGRGRGCDSGCSDR
mmetsp:Transcript_7321/g.20636  ORF Transcript_7321/g.20636 Transcript_7321/m.20636 type:complete len:223 (+) Transcript_7321:17-685(+)